MRARKVRQKKIKRVILMLILIIVMVSATNVIAQRQAEPGEEITYMVQSGDTLWGIASQYRGNTEIRRYIEQIRKCNELQTQHIYPGQILVLPGQ